MSSEPENVETIRSELGTLFGDKNWMVNLHAKPIGPVDYAVLSARNGSPTMHTVDLKEGTCTCEDERYNREGREVCAHVAYAALRHDDTEERDNALLSFVAFGSEQLVRTANRLERLTTGVEADRAAETAQQANAGRTIDAQDMADELDKAFYNANMPINYTVDGERIWFGGAEKDALGDRWEELIRDDDRVIFDPDDAPDPFQKNWIAAGDVEAYLAEHL